MRTDLPLEDSPASWVRLALSLSIAMVGNIGMWAIIVILPAVQVEFAVDRAGASVPYALTMAGFALGNWQIGRIVDRYGITIALIGGALLLAGGLAVAAATSSLLVFGLLHVLIGFGSAASFGPLIADISHWFLRRRGIAVAIVASGNYLAGAIWPLVLAPVLAGQGWRAAYLLLAVIVLAVVIPLSLTLRRPGPARSAIAPVTPPHVGQVSFSPTTLQLLLMVAGVGCCVAMAMPQVHIIAYCVDLGFGAGVGAQMLSLMLLGGVVSRLISGLLADVLGGVRTLLIGSVLQMTALFLFLPADGLVSLYLVSAIFGLSQGGIVPSYAVIVREYMPAAEAGARVGAVIMATIIGMALGGWMSGWIYDVTGTYRMAFINGIVWNGLNVAILALILWNATGGRRRRLDPVAV